LCFYDTNCYAFFKIRDFDDLGAIVIMKEDNAYVRISF